MPKILHNVREGVLLCGRELLLKSGYEDFSMRQVAHLTGIGVGTLYHYFPSKQALVAELLNAEWELYTRRMLLLAREQTQPQARLEAIYQEFRQFMMGIHGTWVGGVSEKMEWSEIKSVQQQRARVKEQLRGIVSAALEGSGCGEQASWLAESISRLLLSCAGDAACEDAVVVKALEKLLR